MYSHPIGAFDAQDDVSVLERIPYQRHLPRRRVIFHNESLHMPRELYVCPKTL